MKTRLVAALVASGLLLAACGGDDDDTASTTTAAAASTAIAATTTVAEGPKDLVDTAVAAGEFGTLVAALEAAGLVDALRAEGPFTVFAPTDDAFAKLPAGAVDALLADKEALTAVLTFHVVPGKVMAADVQPGPVGSLEGSSLTFATTDGVTVNGATVTTPDVEASNGVIHVIDTVLLPPGVSLDEPAQAATVLDVIRSTPDLAQLGIAVTSAGLAETLQGPGPFTVFAPTNAAFAALGAETLNALNADPAQLAPVLTYHVVPGSVLAADVAPGEVPTVNGKPLTIAVNGATVTVNGAKVVTTDLVAGNGVVHVIDAVLLPA